LVWLVWGHTLESLLHLLYLKQFNCLVTNLTGDHALSKCVIEASVADRWGQNCVGGLVAHRSGSAVAVWLHGRVLGQFLHIGV